MRAFRSWRGRHGDICARPRSVAHRKNSNPWLPSSRPLVTPSILLRLRGNRPGDSKSIGLNDAIRSIVDYLNEGGLKDVVLLGHSYGGMIITGVADLVRDKIRRLVYWNAFVPNNNECLNNMVPPHYVELFENIAAQRGYGPVVLPFPIWREAFINDADLETRSGHLTSLTRIRSRHLQIGSRSRPIPPT